MFCVAFSHYPSRAVERLKHIFGANGSVCLLSVLKSCDVPPKHFGFHPVKQYEHPISGGDLFHKIDRSPQHERDTSSIAEERNIPKLNLSQGFTAANIGKEPKIQKCDCSNVSVIDE